MALNSFKALGGVYAVARILGSKLKHTNLHYADEKPLDLASPEAKMLAASTCFVCASAGNHGLSVAAGARIFGAKARVYVSETVPENFAHRLSAAGAKVIRSGATYEDSIAAAMGDADRTGALHLADGSWPGYTERPALVMEGYTVLAEELRDQLTAMGTWPETVFLQAGVGGFAAAIAYMIRENWPEQPEIVIVEPTEAACLAASAATETVLTVEGAVSNMGRLDCKTPSLLAVEALSKLDVNYVQVTDREAQDSATALGQIGIETTPSGAAGFAALQQGSFRGTSLIVATEGNS